MAKYDPWAETYAANRVARTETIGAVIEYGAITKADKVLEVGSGTGNHIIAIKKSIGCEAFGLDQSGAMIRQAEARRSGIVFQQGDAEALTFDDAFFDVIFSVDVIHHLTSSEDYFRTAKRVLRPGGRFVTLTHSHDMLRHNVLAAKYWPKIIDYEIDRYPPTERLLAELAAAGFRNIEDHAMTYPRLVKEDTPYRNKAFSGLHSLSEEDFEAGLQQLADDLANGPIENVGSYLVLAATA